MFVCVCVMKEVKKEIKEQSNEQEKGKRQRSGTLAHSIPDLEKSTVLIPVRCTECSGIMGSVLALLRELNTVACATRDGSAACESW